MLKNRDVTKKYIRIKGGKIYVGKDLENGYDEIEGVITNMYYKDEQFNGADQRKLILVLSDGTDNYQLGVNTGSNSYSALVSFLHNVDLTQPVTLHPREEILKKEGQPDVNKNTILVSQGGKFAKSYFTKDEPHGLPRWDQVKVGKKIVTDKSNYLEFLENFVTTELLPQVSKNVVNKTTVNVPVEQEVIAGEEEDSKLPWDN